MTAKEEREIIRHALNVYRMELARPTSSGIGMPRMSDWAKGQHDRVAHVLAKYERR